MMHLSAAVVCLPSAVMQMCLIMDEVDGMSAGDRGGVADLIQTLKGAKLPIICICNDKYNQKLKSLRNHCLELDFRCDPCSSSLQCCASMQTILPCVSGSAHAIHCCPGDPSPESGPPLRRIERLQEADGSADVEAAAADLPGGGAAGE